MQPCRCSHLVAPGSSFAAPRLQRKQGVFALEAGVSALERGVLPLVAPAQCEQPLLDGARDREAVHGGGLRLRDAVDAPHGLKWNTREEGGGCTSQGLDCDRVVATVLMQTLESN